MCTSAVGVYTQILLILDTVDVSFCVYELGVHVCTYVYMYMVRMKYLRMRTGYLLTASLASL